MPKPELREINDVGPLGTMIISPDEVNDRVYSMGHTLLRKFRDEGVNPLFVTLLNGGAPFAQKLMSAMTSLDPGFHPDNQYMTVSHYADKQKAGDGPGLVLGLPPKLIESGNVEGRLAIILDDMRDRGGTAAFVDDYLRKLGAVEVELVTLLLKDVPGDEQLYKDPLLYGFDVDDFWVTGMGANDARVAPEAGRWVGGIIVAHSSEDLATFRA